MFKYLIGLVVLAAGWLASLYFVFGLGAGMALYQPENLRPVLRHVAQLQRLVPIDVKLCDQADTTKCGFADISIKQEVSCVPYTKADPRTAVLFTLGQSNSANNGSDRYRAVRQVANFNPQDGKCYHAEDPLLGASLAGGAVWGHVGDGLIKADAFDRVLIVAIGIGASPISRWTVNGDLNPRISFALQQLAAQGITPTHILWHQGEADAKRETSQEDYISRFGGIVETIRAEEVIAPIYAVQGTLCNLFYAKSDEAAAAEGAIIRQAQAALPDQFEGVYAGPDTDVIKGYRYRFDNCHMNLQGMQWHAKLWVDVLTAN